jgi:hypothetical protein
MFIAVINENFTVAEEAKRSKQASFWATEQARSELGRPSWMRVLNPYRWFKANPVTVRVHGLPNSLMLRVQKSMVNGYNSTGGGGGLSGGGGGSGSGSGSNADGPAGPGAEELLGATGPDGSARPRVPGLVSIFSASRVNFRCQV